MTWTGTPMDRSGTHAQDRARDSTPGQGMPQMKLNRRFCAICCDTVGTLGGRYRGPLFICHLHPKKGQP